MSGIMQLWAKVTGLLSGTVIESVVLFITRIALALIFWRSYTTKVEEGTWLQISEVQYFIFENEFAGLPLSPDIAVPMTVYAEFFFSILLIVGLFSRFSAAAFAVMAMVIQIFVFPTWDHFFGWAIMVLAMGGIIFSRGPGLISVDAILGRAVGLKAT